MLKKDKDGLIVVNFIIGIIVFAIIGILYGFYYCTNDDILIHNLMTGAYTGVSESRLVYVMYVLGILFKALYLGIPIIDWYALFAITGHCICISICCYRFACLAKRKSVSKILLAMLWFVAIAIDLKYVIAYQYTVFSGILATTAIVCILTFDTGRRVKDYGLILCLLSFSLLLRKEVFALSAPLLMLSVVIRCYYEREHGGKIKIPFLLKGFSIFAIWILALFAIEKIAYSSDEWKEYLAFNEARTQVYDYALMPEYEGNELFYDSLNIDEAKYTALKQMDIEFVPEISTEVLLAIADRQKSILNEWKKYYNVPVHFVKVGVISFLSVLITPCGILLLFLTAFCIVYAILKKNIHILFFGTIPFLFSCTVCAYFANMNRFPERVYYPLLLMSCGPVAYLVIELALEKRIKPWIFLCVITPLFVMQIIDSNAEVDVLKKESQYWVSVIDYAKSDEECLFILDSRVYASTAERMLSDATECNNMLRMSTWLLKSPHQRSREHYVGVRKRTSILIPAYYSTDWIENIIGKIDIRKVTQLNDLMCIGFGGNNEK